MNTITKNQIWTSELNNLASVQAGFDRMCECAGHS